MVSLGTSLNVSCCIGGPEVGLTISTQALNERFGSDTHDPIRFPIRHVYDKRLLV